MFTLVCLPLCVYTLSRMTTETNSIEIDEWLSQPSVASTLGRIVYNGVDIFRSAMYQEPVTWWLNEEVLKNFFIEVSLWTKVTTDSLAQSISNAFKHLGLK